MLCRAIFARPSVFVLLALLLAACGRPEARPDVEQVKQEGCPPTPTPIPQEAQPPFHGRLAFMVECRSHYDIHVMDANGTNLVNVSDHPANDDYFRWAPGGERLLFVSDRDGNREIYLVNRDGSALQRLTDDPAIDDYAQWSPDGQFIAYLSITKQETKLVRMNADGSEKKVLVSYPGRGLKTNHANFEWSPNGGQLLYMGDQSDRWELYLMTVDGVLLRKIDTPPDPESHPINSEWSPNGDLIAFTAGPPMKEKLYLMNPDYFGTPLEAIADHPGRDIAPTWSPDGQQIIFMSTRDTLDHTVLYRMDAEGNHQERLTDPAGLAWISGGWSADGSRFLFYSREGVSLLDMEETPPQLSLLDEGIYPEWSPDEAYISYSKDSALCVMNADGSEPHCFLEDFTIPVPVWWEPVP